MSPLPLGKPLVKVCGITSPGDAAMCTGMGVTVLGFIFHPASPRNVAPSLPALINEVDVVRKVGVFVGQCANEVTTIMRDGKLHLAQLHGGQDEAFCDAVGAERVVKVLWPEKYTSVADLQADLDRFAPHCARFLFDAGSSGGGHGRTMDLSFLRKLTIPRPYFLAGGLGPETIGAALSSNPDGLDLNSGVESAPGIKSRAKLQLTLDTIFAHQEA
ncbi:MAG: phosphoribosylanthranilate isomerase [Proteobacteria bacterium]|nr:phosphoribosylanthranilate isomerase [Pseudomonadota bacterium]MBU1611985.1 phosphoribosylanthranilate isomerase [Pseudomonadota bacterium]